MLPRRQPPRALFRHLLLKAAPEQPARQPRPSPAPHNRDRRDNRDRTRRPSPHLRGDHLHRIRLQGLGLQKQDLPCQVR